MKKFILSLVAMVCTTFAFAQFPGGQMPEFKPEDIATHMTDRLKDSLQINEDQYKKLYDINLKQANEMKTMMDKMMQGERPEFNREAMQKRQDERMERRNEENKAPYALQLSSGYAIYDEENMASIPDVIESADEKMYEDKKRKKSMLATEEVTE